MGKRSTSRRLAMQVLYQADIGGHSIEEALDNVFAEEEFIEETKQFAIDLAKGTWENLAAIDEIIKSSAIDWSFERLNIVDRNILRLAIFELRFAKEKNPLSVIINEAIELSKKYSTPESSRFVNGILGKIVKP